MGFLHSGVLPFCCILRKCPLAVVNNTAALACDSQKWQLWAQFRGSSSRSRHRSSLRRTGRARSVIQQIWRLEHQAGFFNALHDCNCVDILHPPSAAQSDPMVILYAVDASTGAETLVGHTEYLKNNPDPKFQTCIETECELSSVKLAATARALTRCLFEL
jgi:hypothetical protein